MSQAEELLDSLTEDQTAMYGVNPNEEPHIVVQSDRTIEVPNDLRHIAVQGEHNIETVTFDCPRYWDGHDLSQMSMCIVYQRPDGHREPHPVENLRVDEVDENTIHFEWTVSGNVTAVKGNISFMICAKLSDAEGNREREWHTRLNQDLIVDEGMECSGEEIVEQNPDIIESILVRLDTLESSGGTVTDEQIGNAVEAYMAEHPIDPGVDEQQVRDIVDEYLTENPPASNPDSSQNAYELPVGGDELGGVKNGGNVVINEDGTMTAPEASGGGMGEEEKTIILTLFRNAIFDANVGSTISRLEEIWGVSGGSVVGFEMLDDVFYATGWPTIDNGAWSFPGVTEDDSSYLAYTIFKPGEILGGKLTIEYNAEECNNFDISIRTMDANGNAGHTSTGNPLVTGHIDWVVAGSEATTGRLTSSPTEIALPLGEKPYVIFRIGGAASGSYPIFDGIEGNQAKGFEFMKWVTNNVKCTIEED